MADYVPGWQFSFPTLRQDDEQPRRSTGPRRDAPAVCYICGDDVPPGPRFGLEACCDRSECRDAMVRR